ncbi:MAG: amidohydrolase family protein [Phycisphaerales bacterium]
MTGSTTNPRPANLREAHAHLFQLGRSLSMVDLSGCTDRQEMIGLIAERAKTLGGDEWVLAHGARPDGWADPRWPKRTELDHAGGGRAVVAWCFDYHAMVASSAALAHAGIDAGTSVDSGRVELDDDGEPTGLLIEHAALKMWDAVPEPEPAKRAGLVRQACGHLAAMGFVEVHDLKAQPWLGGVLRDLVASGEVSMRFTLFPLMDDLTETIRASDGWRGDAVTLGGGKIFVDGTLSSRTAWMLSPFADGHRETPCGTPMMTHDGIETALLECRALGLPVAAHAIGDAAVRAVLDAVERTGTAHSGCRIEHAEVIDPADVPRFKELGVTASLQPCHLLADIEALGRAIPDRLDRVLPIRDLMASGLEPGVDLLFGSDVPIVRADPDDSIRAAVSRRREGMDASEAINPDQAILEGEAWACFAADG